MRSVALLLLIVSLLCAADSSITDLSRWNHPAKKVFATHNTPVVSLQLLKNKTYPVFSISGKVTDTPAFWNALAKANGYWSYAVIDDSNVYYEISADPKTKTVSNILRSNRISGFYSDTTIQTKHGSVSVADLDDGSGFALLYQGKKWVKKPDQYNTSSGCGVEIKVMNESSTATLILLAFPVSGYNHPVSMYQLAELTETGCRFFPAFGRSSAIYSFTEIAPHRWTAECIESFVHGVDEDGMDRTFKAYTEYTITEKSAVRTAGKPE